MQNSNSFSVFRLSDISDEGYSSLLKRTEDKLDYFLQHVPEIIDSVRLEGDKALARFGIQFDKAEALTEKTILATKRDFNNAFDQLAPEIIETLEYAADNIRSFHEYQKPKKNGRSSLDLGFMLVKKQFQ